MASTQPFVTTKLTEKDVPGASFVHNTLEAHSVLQLKRWLVCRGQRTEGKKKELIERVIFCLKNNIGINSQVDNGHWLNLKVENLRSHFLSALAEKPDYPNNWLKFPSSPVPNSFNEGCIYAYFMQVPMINAADSKDLSIKNVDCGTSKPFSRGKVYLKSKHVQEIMDSVTIDEKFYCMKAQVQASFKANIVHNVFVMLNYKTSWIIDGQCDCKASAMGRCSHVAALLFALEDFIRNGDKENACTSKLCLWNQGRKRKEPHRADEVQYSKTTTQTLRKRDFNPASNVPLADSDKKIKEFFGALQTFNGPTGSVSMWELLLQPEYQDYTLDSESRDILVSLVSKLCDELTAGFDGPICITNNEQSSCKKWWEYRKLLVTASKVKTVINFKSKQQFFTYLKDNLWEAKEIHSVAMEYGRRNEGVARHEYTDSVKTGGFSVENTGLWLNPKFPGLGASPDGLVTDPNVPDSLGLLEIKCPQILETVKPTDVHILSPQQRSSFCSTVDDSGTMKLKHNHSYYFQVQLQMAITERYWCDFVIWTPHGLHIERIMFNDSLANYITSQAINFHKNILAPEYFEMRVPRWLQPFDLSKD